MPEPTTTGVAAGISIKSLIAGGMGGALALSVLKQIGPWKSAASIIGGAFAANYLAPVVRHQLGWPEDFSGAIDFIIGLVFLAVLPAFLEGVQRIVSDPASLARALINRKGGGSDA